MKLLNYPKTVLSLAFLVIAPIVVPPNIYSIVKALIMYASCLLAIIVYQLYKILRPRRHIKKAKTTYSMPQPPLSGLGYVFLTSILKICDFFESSTKFLGFSKSLTPSKSKKDHKPQSAQYATSQPPRTKYFGLAIIGVIAIIIASVITADGITGQTANALQMGKMDAEKRQARRLKNICTSDYGYSNLKDQAFDQAIRIRNADPLNLQTLSLHSFVQMQNPLVKAHYKKYGLTICTGRFVLKLPAGVQDGFEGKFDLEADVEYSAQTSADNSGMVYQIKGIEPIVYKLAAFDLKSGKYDTQIFSTPSFDCRFNSSPAEKIICGNEELTRLDREMSSIFYSAMVAGSNYEKQAIRAKRKSFMAARETCRGEQCIANAYNAFIQELRPEPEVTDEAQVKALVEPAG